jgi:hypothetical protein
VTAILRFPVVAAAFLADRFRRVPGMGWVERHVPWVVAVLLLLAVVALAFWAAQRSPQRISLAALAAGQLPDMQSWIIISGNLQRDPLYPSQFRYVLTDVQAPNANLLVTSDVELETGQTTISGTLVGGRLGTPTGIRWTGQMEADAALAPEQDPPWVALGFVLSAVLIGGATKMSYPVLFRESPAPAPVRARRIPVRIARGSRQERWQPQDATLLLTPGEPVQASLDGAAPIFLRLHSPHTSYDVGELRHLSGAAPALVVRLTSEELNVLFASRADRDEAYAGMTVPSARSA